MNSPAMSITTTKSLASALTGIDGERVALSDVAVTAVLRDLLAEVTVAQTYRNDERIPIEAVYTFPLPLDAVLLELQVELGGRVLKGVVIPKQDAEEAYEDAIDSGDAAVMLQEIEPGLYTMNVGNLLPGEQATITFTYAITYRWTDDRLRFFLPTTVAPRFGESPHQPHQVPEASLTVENQFALRVEISGSLRDAQFVCPSHTVRQETIADKARDLAAAGAGRDGSRLHPEHPGPAGKPQFRAVWCGRRRRGRRGEFPALFPGLAATASAEPGHRGRLLGIHAGRFHEPGKAGAGRHS